MVRNQFENNPDAEPSQAHSEQTSHSELSGATPKTERSDLGGAFQPDSSHARSQRTSASELSALTYRTGRSQLGADFQPSKYSVICGRGKYNYDHIGNYHLRSLASTFVTDYSKAGRKMVKSAIISNIVATIRQEGGCFCKFDNGSWFETGDDCAREKVSSFFRDKLHNHYRSSAKAKNARRIVAQRVQREQNEAQTQQYGTDDLLDSSVTSSSLAQRVQIEQNEAQTQQYCDLLVGGTGKTDDGTESEDFVVSSMTSSCSGSSKDSLGYDPSVEIDFFDIDVF
jgi:hypothetical protein